MIFAGYAGDPDKMAEILAVPGGGSGGGGIGGGGGDGDAGGDGGGDAAEEEKEEEKEEEMDLGGGMDMFGAEEGGGGDY